MFKAPKDQQRQIPEQYTFTHEEIDLLSECIKQTEDYYKGLLLLKQDWNPQQNETAIAMIKSKLRMLDELQDRTTYIGQSEYYKNL